MPYQKLPVSFNNCRARAALADAGTPGRQVLAHEAIEVAQAAVIEAHYYFMFGAPPTIIHCDGAACVHRAPGITLLD